MYQLYTDTIIGNIYNYSNIRRIQATHDKNICTTPYQRVKICNK